MKRNASQTLQIIVAIVSAAIPANLARAQAQLPPDAPLDAQIKALYKATKFGLDSGGFTVLAPGTILVVQRVGFSACRPRT